MTTIIKPPITPISIDFRLERAVRMVRSAEGHSFQREIRSGLDRWIADVTWPPLHGDDRRELDAFLERAARGDVWAMLDWPFGHGGSFPSENLLTNGDFTDGISGWSPNANSELSHNARQLKITKTTASSNALAIQVVGELQSGNPFVLRGEAIEGTDDPGAVFVLRDNDAGSNVLSRATNEEGITTGHINLSTTANYSVLIRGRGAVADTYKNFDSIQLQQTALVNGAGQTGNSLDLRLLPFDTKGLLKAGDFVEIMTDTTVDAEKSELKRLTADLDANESSRIGTMFFEPDLRNSPENDAPIIIHRPRVKTILSNQNRQRRYTQPDLVQITQRFEEDVLA